MPPSSPNSDSKEKSWYGLLLNPLDVLLFRDGRPFGESNRVVSQMPFPQTIAGAIRSALLRNTGFDFAKLASIKPRERNSNQQDPIVDNLLACGANPEVVRANFRGPWLARKSNTLQEGSLPHDILFPFPANLKQSSDDPDVYLTSKPVLDDSVPGWHSPSGLCPLKFSQQPDAKADVKLLTLGGLSKYLKSFESNSEMLRFSSEEVVDPKNLVHRDFRVGNRIDPQRFSTVDGELYGVGFLSLNTDARIYVEIETTADVVEKINDQAISVGGEGRYSHIEVCESCEFPAYDSTRERSLWYVATPTFLDPTTSGSQDHRPVPKSSHGSVVAAASGFGIGISGWDVLRGGPKKTQFAVPAGAVYFLGGPGVPTDFIRDDGLKGALLQEGWGFAIQANWSDET